MNKAKYNIISIKDLSSLENYNSLSEQKFKPILLLLSIKFHWKLVYFLVENLLT